MPSQTLPHRARVRKVLSQPWVKDGSGDTRETGIAARGGPACQATIDGLQLVRGEIRVRVPVEEVFVVGGALDVLVRREKLECHSFRHAGLRARGGRGRIEGRVQNKALPRDGAARVTHEAAFVRVDYLMAFTTMFATRATRALRAALLLIRGLRIHHVLMEAKHGTVDVFYRHAHLLEEALRFDRFPDYVEWNDSAGLDLRRSVGRFTGGTRKAILQAHSSGRRPRDQRPKSLSHSFCVRERQCNLITAR